MYYTEREAFKPTLVRIFGAVWPLSHSSEARFLIPAKIVPSVPPLTKILHSQ